MKKTLSLLTCTLLTQLCLSQGLPELKAHFDQLSNEKSSVIPKKERAKYYQQSDVIPLLENYLQSDNEKVQREAVRFCAEVGANNTNPATRKKAVNLLMTTAQTGSAKILKKITNGLEDFKLEDFDATALEQVAVMVKKKQDYQENWIALAGFLQLRSPLDEIKDSYKGNKKMSQKIDIALTRSGDEAKKASLMRNIKKIKVD